MNAICVRLHGKGSPQLCFEPEPDITAYELSLCLTLLLTGLAANPYGAGDDIKQQWDTMPATATRHFRHGKPA